jgi:hypothetical protein
MDMDGTVKELRDTVLSSFWASADSNCIEVPNLVLFSKALIAGFCGANPFLIIAAFLGAGSAPKASIPIREAAELTQTANKIKNNVFKRTMLI